MNHCDKHFKTITESYMDPSKSLRRDDLTYNHDLQHSDVQKLPRNAHYDHSSTPRSLPHP